MSDPRQNLMHAYPYWEGDLHDLEHGLDPERMCACQPQVLPMLNGTDPGADVIGFVISHNAGVLVRVGVNGHSRIEWYMF